jgi:hypothetical protein
VTAPALGSVARRAHNSLGHLSPGDDLRGYPFAHFLEGLGRLLQPFDDIVREQADGVDGLAAFLDPDRAPVWALPYIAMSAGVRLPRGLAAAAQREAIKQNPAQDRGTLPALNGAARRYLTDPENATVYVLEQHGGPHIVTVTTFAEQTPDPAKVQAALRARDFKPLGIRVNHSAVVGGDLQTLRDTHLDLAEIAADFADLNEVRNDPGHT